jgi:hypothetical protein
MWVKWLLNYDLFGKVNDFCVKERINVVYFCGNPLFSVSLCVLFYIIRYGRLDGRFGKLLN